MYGMHSAPRATPSIYPTGAIQYEIQLLHEHQKSQIPPIVFAHELK